MILRLLGPEDISKVMSMRSAIQAIAAYLATGFDPEAEAQRTIADVPGGQLLFMPAAGNGYAGAKLISLAPGNAGAGIPRIHGLYVLFDGDTLEPVALLDGGALTSLRTPAVSAVAIDGLAVPNAETMVIFGTGPQARGHLEAARQVRPIRQVGVVGRTLARAREFVEKIDVRGLDVKAVSAEAVSDADVIICSTNSRTPLFPGSAVRNSSLVVAVGSHEASVSEVDAQLVKRSTVVVESRSAALHEAGDILQAMRLGGLQADCISGSLSDLVHGRLAVKTDAPRFFKSVGMAWEDLVVAAAVFDALRSKSSPT